MESEQFYVIASKAKGGQWNKLAKAIDLPGLRAIPFFWNVEDAKSYLERNMEKDLREFYAVFCVDIMLNEAVKVS